MPSGTHRSHAPGALAGLLLVATLVAPPPAVAEHAAGPAAGPVGLAPPAAPANPPAVTGTTRVGAALTGDDGVWEGQPTLTRYWLRCDLLGADCVFIHHTAPTYTLTSADRGWRIRLRVLATNATGAREVESEPTAAVEAALPPPPPPPPPAVAALPPGRPQLLAAPSLRGRMREGSRIRVQSGLWSGHVPMSFANRWERCDARRCIPTGTTGPIHVLRRADVGNRMRVRVSVSNASGATTVFSEQSAPVKPPPPAPQPMKPFPRIQISGFIGRGGVRMRRLAVRAPPRSTVSISCRGRGCPFSSARARLRSDLFIVRRMTGRFLRIGMVVEMRVTGGGRIGKFTRFRIRRGVKPARVDRCLVPGKRTPSRCVAVAPRR